MNKEVIFMLSFIFMLISCGLGFFTVYILDYWLGQSFFFLTGGFLVSTIKYLQ